MFYFIKTPQWLKRIYPSCIWQMDPGSRNIYLSFDDGPHPRVTSFVLDELIKHRAKATFFCLGKNVMNHPGTYKRIVEEGHAVGNHSFDHPNGWKTRNTRYLANVAEAKKYIDSNLFRPPYGKITPFQLMLLKGAAFNMRTVMWSVLSADFDKRTTPEQCLDNVTGNATGGSIVVFHDSEKSEDKLRYALPIVLEHFGGKGYRFEKITG
jgi:peptidoglycan/xylan/chitin deacetylase (PgdA/CDA1 family)